MKRTLSGFVTIALLCSIVLIPASAQDDQTAKISEGKKILEQTILASGGREILSKIKDTTVQSEMNIIPMGLTTNRVIYTKDSEKIRVETKVMGTMTILCFDGKSGWILTPQSPTAVDMPQPVLEELKKSAIESAARMNPEKYGTTITYEGRESFEGKEYLVLKQTYEEGDASTIYLDPDTYIPYKMVSLLLDESIKKVETEIIFSDYRVVEEMKVPFFMHVIQSGEDYIGIKVTEYKYNTGLEDSLFERPQ